MNRKSYAIWQVRLQGERCAAMDMVGHRSSRGADGDV